MRSAAVPEGTHGTFLGADGTPLHRAAWEVEAPRAALLLSHGIGEHSGRYAALARDLAGHRISVYALDHRGNGRSPGRRGHVRRFREFTDDLEAFRRSVAGSLPPGLPVFLLGHSLGGLIALRYLQAYPEAPLAGAILSSPALGIAVEAPAWKTRLAGVLSRVLPALPFANEIDPAHLTHDREIVDTYRDDPLVHPRITPRLYTEMLTAIRLALAEGERIRVPLLFLIPDADRVVRPAAAQAFARGLACDVTVRVYPGFFHESLNEVGRERVVEDIAAWIDRQIT
ncbi:MAG TPA: alpha/beta hydrolase [Longimicrobiaceae bacterium]|nr:alpha/beta hydrolase [Longimicrobiaceae bacterium]